MALARAAARAHLGPLVLGLAPVRAAERRPLRIALQEAKAQSGQFKTAESVIAKEGGELTQNATAAAAETPKFRNTNAMWTRPSSAVGKSSVTNFKLKRLGGVPV